MYTAFNLLNLDLEYLEDLEDLEDLEEILNKLKEYFSYEELYKNKNIYIDAQDIINNFIEKGGTIKKDILKNKLFPNIKADIFISHSHKDKELAVRLKEWLFNKFNLTSFIDSDVWEYSRDFVTDIVNTNKMYISKKNQDGSMIYKYHETLNLNSNIDMLLSTSLIEMIDISECLLFLNTDNFSKKEMLNDHTSYSQWIYLETFISNIIRKRQPDRFNEKNIEMFFSSEGLYNIIEYDLPIKYFINIYPIDLYRWSSLYHSNNIHPLDILYTLKSMEYRNN